MFKTTNKQIQGCAVAAAGMESGDEWWARDKLYHVLFCYLIAAVFAAALHRSRRPLLRRWSFPLASLVSLAAGAAKEVADEVGLWHSAGASYKDAVADLAGVLLASTSSSLWRSLPSRRASEPAPADLHSMV